MSLITQVFEYSEPYKRKVFGGGGQINSDRLLKSMLLFFVQNELTENVLFAWNEFCGAKDGKCYNPFGTNELSGTQEYDMGMVLFNGTDQSATVDVSGYSTIAIAYRIGDEVIITNSLTGLGEISGNTLYLGSNAAGTEFYGFDLLALVVLNTSAYQLVESYLEMIPLGSKLKQILTFLIGEQLAVGQVNEPIATSFEITEGADTFEIDNSGNITFKTLPDYDIKRTYNLTFKSDKGRIYIITVYVTILTTTTILTGTEIMYNDTYILAA